MWSKIPEKFSISGKEKEKPSAGSCHSSLYTVIHNIFLFFIIVQCFSGRLWEGSGCLWEGSGCEVPDLGGIVYFATGICSFCWVLRGRSAGFAGFSVLRGRREQGWVDFFRRDFQAGLSGGTFRWDARTTSAGPGCLRSGETGIFGSFSGARKMSARLHCLRSRETRGRHFSVRFLSRGLCQQDHVVFARASLYGHCYMGIVVQGKCWETRGQRQGGHIVFIARLWTFVGGVGVRSTGFGRNRVLRDWNLFILLGFEEAKCRICWIFGTSRETGTGARIKKTASPGVRRMQRIFIK